MSNQAKPNKTLKLSGTAQITSDGDKLIIAPQDGLVTVWIGDKEQINVYFFHPMTGWYVEQSMNIETAPQGEP